MYLSEIHTDLSDRILCVSSSVSLLSITLPIILPAMDSSDMSVWLSQEKWLPFHLYRWMTFAQNSV